MKTFPHFGPLYTQENKLPQHGPEMDSLLFPEQMGSLEQTVADFKYGVRFNTYGNTNVPVDPSLLTQSKMLTTRPTQNIEPICIYVHII